MTMTTKGRIVDRSVLFYSVCFKYTKSLRHIRGRGRVILRVGRAHLGERLGSCIYKKAETFLFYWFLVVSRFKRCRYILNIFLGSQGSSLTLSLIKEEQPMREALLLWHVGIGWPISESGQPIRRILLPATSTYGKMMCLGVDWECLRGARKVFRPWRPSPPSLMPFSNPPPTEPYRIIIPQLLSINQNT